MFALKRAAYRDYVVATWGKWDDRWQRERFTANFDPHAMQIIVVDGRDAGALHIDWQVDPVFLLGIELLPDLRRRGIGSEVIRDLLTETATRGTDMRLQVLKSNPAARRLYERLGFLVYGASATHDLMRYTVDEAS